MGLMVCDVQFWTSIRSENNYVFMRAWDWVQWWRDKENGQKDFSKYVPVQSIKGPKQFFKTAKNISAERTFHLIQM